MLPIVHHALLPTLPPPSFICVGGSVRSLLAASCQQFPTYRLFNPSPVEESSTVERANNLILIRLLQLQLYKRTVRQYNRGLFYAEVLSFSSTIAPTTDGERLI